MSIKIENLTFYYDYQTPLQHLALDNINIDINNNKTTAIIGKTGSGKSTLIQHLNALLRPIKGSLYIDDFIINNNNQLPIKQLRKHVGLVFQFPEYQLFEETILKDVMFGPINFNIDKTLAKNQAIEALNKLSISKEDYNKSPLDLSGGQKRKIAIAGVLATNPSIIVLDEPTAGLDPITATNIMKLFKSLNKTIIIVTHDMEAVLEYADDIIVLDNNKIIYHKNKIDFFNNIDILNNLDIELPNIIKLKQELIKANINVSYDNIDLDNIVKEIVTDINKCQK